MGVEVYVPIGATECSLTLTVIMRDFDPGTDSHPFADQVLQSMEFVTWNDFYLTDD